MQIKNETILEVDEFMQTDELCKQLSWDARNELRQELCEALQQVKNKFFDVRADSMAQHAHDLTTGSEVDEQELAYLKRDQYEADRGESKREEESLHV